MNNRDEIIHLWDYEEEAVLAFLPEHITKGRLDLPTGGGKGVIGRELALRLSLLKETPFVAVGFSPRLILNKQWAKACNTHLNRNGKGNRQWHLIFVGSDPAGKTGLEFEKEHQKSGIQGTIPAYSTTNSRKLRERVEFLIQSNYNVLIISTYHSNHVVRRAGFHIDLAFYDEAHFLPTGKSELLVCENDFFAATELNADKKVFATATPRITASSHGKGMNNEDVYGPVVFRRSPRELIEAGAIIGPILHVIGTNPEIEGILDVDDEFSFLKNTPDIDARAFNKVAEMVTSAHEEHKGIIKTRSAFPDKLGAKLLVPCAGQGQLMGIMGSKYFKKWREKHPHVKIYALCVDWGIEFDGRHHKRVTNKLKEDFLNSLWQMKCDDDAIIFHVDMIGVGLDVPLLTGVMYLRSCNLTKFQQNNGRGARLHPYDRQRIGDKELQVCDYTNYVKSKYYVIVPYCFNDKEDLYKRYRDWLVSLRSDYGFDPSELVVSANMQPAPTDDSDDSLPPGMRGIAQEDMLQFFHRIEHDEIVNEQCSYSDEFIKELKSGNKEIIRSLFGRAK